MTMDKHGSASRETPRGNEDHYFVLEEFSLKDEGQRRVERTMKLTAYEMLMSASFPGARRLLTCGALSGNPSRYAQLWSFPDRHAPEVLKERIPQVRGEAIKKILAGGDPPAPKVLTPTGYSPGRRAGLEPRTTPIVLMVHMRVHDGQRRAVERLKKDFFVPFVREQRQWQLYAAGWSTEDGDQAINFWALESAEDLHQVMKLLSENSIYQGQILPALSSERHDLYWLDGDAQGHLSRAHG